MKRPPGLWILLSAGVLWLSLQDVYGIRATALIFGKSTTTTTETASVENSNSSSSTQDESTTDSTPESNTTKPTLTGNPQIDYIWDPNLPKELNGYNLSTYPFYERVPEDINFKCDGLHDGFYASVPHKCQVYHHCLFGTRYDFLCANYTAFDQKTFICHFVSEVDCVNSKKYWHRNDALYQAATTTTPKPVIVYTSPPQPPPVAPAAILPPRRPSGGRRRPSRRRRPQYDYYDYDDEDEDYYEERPRGEGRRRKRPRPRPRPIYDDDYEEYEDERYERRRQSYNRRDSEDRRSDRRRNKDRRNHEEDDVKMDEEEKRPNERRYHKRRPVDEYSDEEEDRRRSRPKNSRRPIDEEYEDEELPLNDKTSETANGGGDKPMIKPLSGSSIYDRPRAAPKIKPPVPKNEANKYAYKPISSTTKTPPTAEDEEYYDEYEEEPPPKNQRKSEKTHNRRDQDREFRKQASRIRPQQSREEEEVVRRPYKPKYGGHHHTRSTTSTKKPPQPEEEYYDDYEEDIKEHAKPERKETSTTTSTTTTTPKPTTTTPKDLPRPETIVRIVKRPFLPSRGGNPYSSRGLQPVGAKAVETKELIIPESNNENMEIKHLFKSSPGIKMPTRSKLISIPSTASEEQFKPVSNRPQASITRSTMKPSKEYSGPRTTQKPKIIERDPLDIDDDNEFDVTLNDALNPTLPNLPVRSFPTGFSAGNDYNYNNNFQRNRYVLEGASSDYVYQTKPRPKYETVSYSNPPQERFVSSDADYKGQYSTIIGQNYRPRLTQAYYSSF